MKKLISLFSLITLSAQGSSYQYTTAKVDSYDVLTSKEISVKYFRACNQKYISTSIMSLTKPSVRLEEPLIGVSIVLYTDHRIDCAPGDTLEIVKVDLDKDIGLSSGIEFIQP